MRTESRSWEPWWRTGRESPRACSELALSGIFGQGCPSQEMGFLLWKAVEKDIDLKCRRERPAQSASFPFWAKPVGNIPPFPLLLLIRSRVGDRREIHVVSVKRPLWRGQKRVPSGLY